jgi:hypothetical protein
MDDNRGSWRLGVSLSGLLSICSRAVCMTHEWKPGIDGTRTMRHRKEFGSLVCVGFTAATTGRRMDEISWDRKKLHSLKLDDSATPPMRSTDWSVKALDCRITPCDSMRQTQLASRQLHVC